MESYCLSSYHQGNEHPAVSGPGDYCVYETRVQKTLHKDRLWIFIRNVRTCLQLLAIGSNH